MSSRPNRPGSRTFPSFTPAIPPDWQVLHKMSLQQQESIRSWLKEFNLAETRQRVASELGVQLSPAALAYLQQGHLLCFQLLQAIAITRMLHQELRPVSLCLEDTERVSLAIHLHFEQQALATGDLAGFARLRRLRQQDQLLEMRKRESARREETDRQYAIRLFCEELHALPDCLEEFKALRLKILSRFEALKAARAARK